MHFRNSNLNNSNLIPLKLLINLGKRNKSNVQKCEWMDASCMFIGRVRLTSLATAAGGEPVALVPLPALAPVPVPAVGEQHAGAVRLRRAPPAGSARPFQPPAELDHLELERVPVRFHRREQELAPGVAHRPVRHHVGPPVLRREAAYVVAPGLAVPGPEPGLHEAGRDKAAASGRGARAVLEEEAVGPGGRVAVAEKRRDRPDVAAAFGGEADQDARPGDVEDPESADCDLAPRGVGGRRAAQLDLASAREPKWVVNALRPLSGPACPVAGGSRAPSPGSSCGDGDAGDDDGDEEDGDLGAGFCSAEGHVRTGRAPEPS